MKNANENHPVNLRNMKITDAFWEKEMELVRTEVIPYQWAALNDLVEGADPSYAMHNFRAAAALKERRKNDPDFREPVFGVRDFQILPEDPVHPAEDAFYGFVFQDTDLYKFIEAAAYSLIQFPDEKLEATCDGAIELVERAQAEDGYLDTYYILNGRDREFTNLRDNHELYCFGHLLEAAVAYYEATGKDRLLQTARRYAAYVRSKIGREEGKKRGYPGHEVAELALVKLYNVTKDPEDLKLAEYFIDERGQSPLYFDLETRKNADSLKHDYMKNEQPYSYFQAHIPVRQQDEALGHSVRAVYLYSGMADVARATDDEALKEACRKLWHSATCEKMYITGSIGATHVGEAFSFPFDLPNDTAYAESCAAIGLMFFARRMLEMEPKAEYGDVLEKCLYNGVLSGMALDGKSFFYVNPLEVLPEACHIDHRKKHVKPVRQKWFGCACCPPNIARLLSSVGSYIYTESDDTLFVHLYIGSSYEKDVNGKNVKITSEINEENDSTKVKFKVSGAENTGFRLSLRNPAWSKKTEVSARDAEITEADGMLYVKKDWAAEDLVEISFKKEVRFMAADSRVREDIGKAAVMYGPMVYCLEAWDNGENLHMLTLRRDVKPEAVKTLETEISGVKAEMLLVPGNRTAMTTGSGLYHEMKEEEKTPVTLKYIPYFMWANRGENEMQVFTRVE